MNMKTLSLKPVRTISTSTIPIPSDHIVKRQECGMSRKTGIAPSCYVLETLGCYRFKACNGVRMTTLTTKTQRADCQRIFCSLRLNVIFPSVVFHQKSYFQCRHFSQASWKPAAFSLFSLSNVWSDVNCQLPWLWRFHNGVNHNRSVTHSSVTIS